MQNADALPYIISYAFKNKNTYFESLSDLYGILCPAVRYIKVSSPKANRCAEQHSLYYPIQTLLPRRCRVDFEVETSHSKKNFATTANIYHHHQFILQWILTPWLHHNQKPWMWQNNTFYFFHFQVWNSRSSTSWACASWARPGQGRGAAPPRKCPLPPYPVHLFSILAIIIPR